jgi:hypothetical protein
LGYAIDKWGSSALQVGNVAAFVIDVALQEFGKGACWYNWIGTYRLPERLFTAG